MFKTYIDKSTIYNVYDCNPDVVSITRHNISEFVELFKNENDLDSYATSPAYYVYTGRRGLWIYRRNDTFVPFCLHPNIEDQILVFPTRGKKDFDVVESLIKELSIPAQDIKLARIKSDDASDLPDHLYSHIQEDGLDWKYPAHIFSTKQVSDTIGHKYMLVRNRLRQTKKYSVHVEILSQKHLKDIRRLACRWASMQTDDKSAIIDLTSPYTEILRITDIPCLNLSGLVFFVDGELQAATIWDASNSETPIANVYMNLCNISYKGLSELAINTTAKTLYERGVSFMTLGGSETASLDRFKRKFAPISHVQLHSLMAVSTNFTTLSHITTREVRAA